MYYFGRMESQMIDPKAKSLHNEARELGQAGKYDSSIAKLEQAIAIQPDWAYPVYDMAFTYLLKGDFDNALMFYKKTDELEPKGFFTAKTALYALEGEHAGIFPKGLYMYYLQIEWTEDVNKKLEIVKTIIENVPDFAPAWKELAFLTENEEERESVIEQGLSKNPDPDTKGILLINKAVILNDNGNKEKAKQLLGDLIFSPEATLGNVELAKFTLQSIGE
jgi:tetratricopeptide (TPR) repeat protein